MRRALALAGVALLLGCAPRRIVQLDPPGVPTEANPYAGRDVVVGDFVVRNKDSDSERAEAALREQFASYLTRLGSYQSVSDAPAGGAQLASGALRVDASFDLALDDKKNYVVGLPAFVPVWGLLWPFHPRRGQATVTGTVSVFDARQRLLGSKTWTKSEPYEYMLWGFFRTSPIEQAYKLAYEDVFAHLAVPLKDAAREAAPADAAARVYRSDVDRPTYSLPARPEDFAVVIGIEKYSTAPSAPFAERDAKAVREHLLALGYPPRNIVYLTQEQATRANVEKYVESWLPRNVKPSSRVFFYFSGHGAPDVASGKSYLVPWDGDPRFLESTGYPIARLYRGLNALPAREVLVAMDSCFSGAGGRSILPAGARPLLSKTDARLSDVGKLIVLTASGADEISGSDESQGHGLFTYHLLKALNDRSGPITVQQLYDAVAPAVADAARRDNRDQRPRLLPVGLGAQARVLVRGK